MYVGVGAGCCLIIKCHYLRFFKRQFSHRLQSQLFLEVPGGLHYDRSLY